MKPILAALCAVAALGLAACETATPYQPRVPGAKVGGYSEEQISKDRWRVRFSGNALTSRETVERYLFYRSAELTLQQGGDWFRPLNQTSEQRHHFVLEREVPEARTLEDQEMWEWRPDWRTYQPHTGWQVWRPKEDDPFRPERYEVREITRYVATAEIVIGSGPAPKDQGAFDARQVTGELGPGIIRPAE